MGNNKFSRAVVEIYLDKEVKLVPKNFFFLWLYYLFVAFVKKKYLLMLSLLIRIVSNLLF